MALNINGRMKVKTLRSEFKTEFGLTLRIYDGRSFANDDSTLASIRKGDSKGGEFAPKRNTKVGTFEIKMMNMFGIKVQVAGSDDSYLCLNNLTIAGAQEEDNRKIKKKESGISSITHETTQLGMDEEVNTCEIENFEVDYCGDDKNTMALLTYWKMKFEPNLIASRNDVSNLIESFFYEFEEKNLEAPLISYNKASVLDNDTYIYGFVITDECNFSFYEGETLEDVKFKRKLLLNGTCNVISEFVNDSAEEIYYDTERNEDTVVEKKIGICLAGKQFEYDINTFTDFGKFVDDFDDLVGYFYQKVVDK